MNKKFLVAGIIAIFLIVALFFGVYNGFITKDSGTLCEDSDAQEPAGVYPRGINTFEEGRTTRASVERVDYCSTDGTSVREFSCKSGTLLTSSLIKCPSGKCENGACV